LLFLLFAGFFFPSLIFYFTAGGSFFFCPISSFSFGCSGFYCDLFWYLFLALKRVFLYIFFTWYPFFTFAVYVHDFLLSVFLLFFRLFDSPT